MCEVRAVASFGNDLHTTLATDPDPDLAAAHTVWASSRPTSCDGLENSAGRFGTGVQPTLIIEIKTHLCEHKEEAHEHGEGDEEGQDPEGRAVRPTPRQHEVT